MPSGGQRQACHRDNGDTGYFMAPMLITDTHAAMRISREEIFGPMVSVMRVKDDEPRAPCLESQPQQALRPPS